MPPPITLLTRPPTILPRLTPRTLPQRSPVVPVLSSATRTTTLRIAVIWQSDNRRLRAVGDGARLGWPGVLQLLAEVGVELGEGGVFLEGLLGRVGC